MGWNKRTRRGRGDGRRSRVLVRGGVYLLWGLLLTWVVAWVLAGVASPWYGSRRFEVLDIDRAHPQLIDVDVTFGATSAVCLFETSAEQLQKLFARRAFDRDKRLPGFAKGLVPGVSSSDCAGTFAVHATGWPWRALAYELPNSESDNHQMLRFPNSIYSPFPRRIDPKPTGVLRVAGQLLPSRAYLPDNELWLPLLPLWRGLVANVLFYALLVLVLRRGFVLLRGRRRRRRGRCWVRGGCGYDLTGLDTATCPECGRPVGVDAEPDAPARSPLL